MAALRIRRFFELESQWRGFPPDQIQRLRDQSLRPQMLAFFDWAAPHPRVGVLRLLSVGVGLQQRLAQQHIDARVLPPISAWLSRAALTDRARVGQTDREFAPAREP